MVKQKLTLSIDKDIITQAKTSGINLSSFLEIRLTDYLMVKKCSRRDSNPNLLVKNTGFSDYQIINKKERGRIR